VIGVTDLAELDGVQLMADASRPVRARVVGAGDQVAGEVRSQRRLAPAVLRKGLERICGLGVRRTVFHGGSLSVSVGSGRRGIWCRWLPEMG
jgi:hypothetical protein